MTDIKKEIKKFVHLSTQDDHSKTDACLKGIIDAKIEARYNTEMGKIKATSEP